MLVFTPLEILRGGGRLFKHPCIFKFYQLGRNKSIFSALKMLLCAILLPQNLINITLPPPYLGFAKIQYNFPSPTLFSF